MTAIVVSTGSITTNVKSIKSKHVAGYSICILKNNARGYPATVTAIDIIDTMYVFIDLFISVRCF